MKKSVVGIVVLLCVWGWAFWAYTYLPSLLSDKYSDSYSLEEVNEKIFSHQIKGIKEIEKNLEKELSKVNKYKRVSWDMDIDIQWTSSLGWWNWGLKIGNFDLQLDKRNLDFQLSDSSASMDFSLFWDESSKYTLSIDALHWITNGSWSYLQAKNIEQESNDGAMLTSLPEELIMTLNKLSEGDTYINLSENVVYDMLSSQLESQSDSSEQIQQLVKDFLNKEALVEAYKQEGTKYFLAPSRVFCAIKKWKSPAEEQQKTGFGLRQAENSLQGTIANMVISSKAISYEEFKNKITDCSEEEYQSFVQEIMDNTEFPIQELYIELSATKAHIVAKAGNDTVNFMYENTSELTSTIQSKLQVEFRNEKFSGSGILLEYQDEALNGYIDIDVPEVWIDTNITLSGNNETIILWGGYSISISEPASNRSLQMLQGVSLVWTLSWTLSENNGSIDIKNIITGSEKNTFSWELDISNSYNSQDTVHQGEMIINGKMQLSEGATPMSWESRLNWSVEDTENMQKWDYEFSFDIPNIASATYDIKYNLNYSDQIDATFTSPEKIVPQKNLNSLMRINKIKLGAKNKNSWLSLGGTLGNTTPSSRDLTLPWRTLNPDSSKNFIEKYNLDERNLKAVTNLRTLASIIEIWITTWDYTLQDIIGTQISKVSHKDWYVTVWYPNYDKLKQRKENFLIHNNSELFIWYFKDGDTEYYQIFSYRENEKWEKVAYIKWNYIPTDNSYPSSLFWNSIQKKSIVTDSRIQSFSSKEIQAVDINNL